MDSELEEGLLLADSQHFQQHQRPHLESWAESVGENGLLADLADQFMVKVELVELADDYDPHHAVYQAKRLISVGADE